MKDNNDYNPYKSVYVPDEQLWERIKEKAGRSDIDRSISKLVCRFFELWLDNKIEPYPEKAGEDNA